MLYGGVRVVLEGDSSSVGCGEGLASVRNYGTLFGTHPEPGLSLP